MDEYAPLGSGYVRPHRAHFRALDLEIYWRIKVNYRPYLFLPYTTNQEKRDFCFYCHDGVAAPAPSEPPFEHGSMSLVPCVNCHYRHNPAIHGGGSGSGCEACHGHDAGYEYAPGQFSEGRGTCESHSTHTENDADDLRGPFLACDVCHDTTNYPAFQSGSGNPPYDLSETDVCDACHSPEGAFDGVNDPMTGAKQGNGGEPEYNWRRGVYDDEGELETGLSLWCVTCHDDVPAHSEPDGVSGIDAPNMIGDNATYGYFVTGHGRPAASGDYDRMSWQGASESGNPAADVAACTACHEGQPEEPHIDHVAGTTDRLPADLANDQNNSNCNACHDPSGPANGDPQFYASSGEYELSSHGGTLCTECHEVHGASGTQSAMTRADGDSLCFECHTEGMVQNDALSNNRPGGYVGADDIEQAFAMSEKHDLGTPFTLGGETYTLECVSCHNVHIVNGKYWDAEEGDKSPTTRFSGNEDGVPVTEIWGDETGEKMDDFAALGAGTGGWYTSVARGRAIVWDRPAVYQPPKSGNGYAYEFGGDVLPDYTSLCLDCHSYRTSDANPPVNWGQGIDCTDNGVDPPDQRIECGAQHGLAAANRPMAWGGSSLQGSSGNPDPIFHEPGVLRGRGATHFMRWPYDSAYRHAGINFVMSCTDCHEAHGSNRGSMIRERFNVNANGDCGTGGNADPDGENCSDGGNWNSFCNACHYYYGAQHAGMSCGNASCHEANSIHRIIHVTHSGGTDLWTEPSRPTTTPEITNTDGLVGSNEIFVTFADSVCTDREMTGPLVPEDFLLTDVGGNNPRTITDVIHTAGTKYATIVMSAPLTSADIGVDLLATRGISVWSSDSTPAGPWTISLPTCPTMADFQLNDPAGSPNTEDESAMIIGTVSDPFESFPGDGFFHGDTIDNYIDFLDNTTCLNATRKLTLEFQIKTLTIDLDSDNPDRNNTIQTLFQREASYFLRIIRADWQENNMPDPGEASLIFKYKPVERYGGPAWKQAITDVDLYPLLANRFYRIRLTFNSDIVGDIPVDIYIDDLGENGDDAGELWAGFPNCTKLQEPDDPWRSIEGDEIISSSQACRIGAKTGNLGHYRFMGLMDRATVELDATFGPPIVLKSFHAQMPLGADDGVMLRWIADSGEGVVTGYRLERREIGRIPWAAGGGKCTRKSRGAGVWVRLCEVNDATDSYYDSEGGPGYEYRLFSVNELGEEVLLGEASIDARPRAVTLAAWPTPYTNGKMNITFAVVGDGRLGSHARANVGVYNVAGRLVRTVASGTYPAGVHDVSWNGKDERGRTVAPGIYFLRAVTGERTDVRKVVVVR